MIIRKVCKFCPVFIFFSKYTKKWFNRVGVTFLPFPIVLIEETVKEDIGLIAHESIHGKQAYTYPFISGFLYLFSKKFRYKMEVEGYKEQLKYCPDRLVCLSRFAKSLSTKYNEDVTEAKALSDLV